MIAVRSMVAIAFVAMTGSIANAAPLSVYGSLPSIEKITISPDGKLLALAVTNGEERRIVVRQIASEKTLWNLNAGTQKVRDISWAGDEHLIISSSSTGYIPFIESPLLESRMGADLDLATGKQRPLLDALARSITKEVLTSIYSRPMVRMIDGVPMVFVIGIELTPEGRGQPALFRVNIIDLSATVDAHGYPSTQNFVVGQASALAEADYEGTDGKWVLRARKADHWEIARRETALYDPPELVGPGRDGASILVRFLENQQPVLRELNLQGAPVGGPLPMPDASAEFYDTSNQRLIGQAGMYGDETRYAFFDPHDAAVWKAITAAYPGQAVDLVDYDAARDKYVVRVDSPSEGPAFALVDLANKHAGWIGAEYLGLKAPDISPVQAIRFSAKDGFALSGYLTTPRGKAEKALPLVVLVHGGPAGRDEPGFDWWSQALASRGYAVLRVNYRGSGGLGWAYEAAGFGEWGRKMQTDLSDGVRYLAGQGTIDPKRVCIAGASYGGYAALAGASLDTGVYRCAASVAGPSDLARMIHWFKGVEVSGTAAEGQRYWTRYMGSPEDLDQISPAKHTDKVAVPILLIHGKDDTVVDYQQSQIMADALTKAGKPFEFVTLKAEDHWLSRGATRLEMLEALTAFLEKNNPPG